VDATWLADIESLEAISQNDEARRLFLRVAALTEGGGLPAFVAEVVEDDDLDDMTKDRLAELAEDQTFVLAVAEYLRRTQRVH
jgi:hypothetical protein